MDSVYRDVLFLLTASMRTHAGDRSDAEGRRVTVNQVHKGPGPGIGREENQDKPLPPHAHGNGKERFWTKTMILGRT